MCLAADNIVRCLQRSVRPRAQISRGLASFCVQSPVSVLRRDVSKGVTSLKRSIFYLDDEISLLEIFQEMFGDEYDVSTASRLDEARRVLAECSADIIISDQLMPEIEGTRFLAEAARMCPHSFRVLLTGNAVVGDVIPEISTGIVHLFLTKPWTEAEMRDVLERAKIFLESWGKIRCRCREGGKANDRNPDSH